MVANLDVVKPKNSYQVRALPEYEFIFLSYRAPMETLAASQGEILVYPKPILRRCLFSLNFFLRNRRRIHHVELYTGNGGYVGIELLIAKLFGLKVVAAERGALLTYPSARLARRASMRLVYTFADVIWIRERWMPASLRKIVSRDAFFNGNAIDTSNFSIPAPTDPRDIDFLWVNSFKPWRYPARFCLALKEAGLLDAQVHMVGLLEKTSEDVLAEQSRAQELAGPNVCFHPFCDPHPFFRRARYFVLPADVVFLNFALLEAMAHGVVPLIADVEGARDIVDHEVDGFIFPHNPTGLREALTRASQLPDSIWQSMSARAMEKVSARFSMAAWAERMRDLYRTLERQ